MKKFFLCSYKCKSKSHLTRHKQQIHNIETLYGIVVVCVPIKAREEVISNDINVTALQHLQMKALQLRFVDLFYHIQIPINLDNIFNSFYHIQKFKIIYNFISNTYKFLHSKRIILPLNLTISLKSVNKSSRKKY